MIHTAPVSIEAENASDTAERVEQRINDTLHLAISRSLEHYQGRDPRIESFSPSPRHVGGHAQRLTTVSSGAQVLEVMVVVSSAAGQWQIEVSVFHRSASDPADSPSVDILEGTEAHFAADLRNTLATHVEAYFTGLKQSEVSPRTLIQ